MSLSILCVSKGEAIGIPFIWDMTDFCDYGHAEFVLCADGEQAERALYVNNLDPIRVNSGGFIESVLDEAIGHCDSDYILRLDDDERMSPAMEDWMSSRAYEAADHWAFPRANLWGKPRGSMKDGAWTRDHAVLVNPPLWPDLQTRLSVKAKAGGRRGVHDGSPFGTGRIAPAVIEHHKYLVKGRSEREAQAAHYDALRPGAGSAPHFRPFMVPEAAFPDGLLLAPLGDGDAAAIDAAARRVLVPA